MNNLLSEKDTKAVLDILVEQLGVEESQLAPDVALVEDLCADSLAIMEITLALEDYFSISLPDSAPDRIRTIGDVFEVLSETLQRCHRGA